VNRVLVNYGFGWMKVVFDWCFVVGMKFGIDLGKNWIGLVRFDGDMKV
jgi:hypothetical protein